MSTSFCPACGAARKPGVRFCGACGGALADGGSPAAGAAPVAVPASGWHVAVGDQLPAFAPAASAPSAPPGAAGQAKGAIPPAAAPASPSMRGASFQLLLASGTDLAAAYATSEPAAMKLATVRAALTGLTVLAGLISGRSRGFFSRIAMLSSLALAAVQSTSLYSFGTRIAANPQLLSGLLPNVATQSLSFMAALRTALAARR